MLRDMHSVAVTQGDPNYYSEHKCLERYCEAEGHTNYGDPEPPADRQYARCPLCGRRQQWLPPLRSGGPGAVVCRVCHLTTAVPKGDIRRVKSMLGEV